MALTKKQRAFVEAYLVDANATRAAHAAGYRGKHVAVTAYRLLKLPAVAAEIARRRGGGPMPAPIGTITRDPLEFLLAVMRDPDSTTAQRVRAAVAAARYTHVRPGTGKKETASRKAAEVAREGRFAPPQPPNVLAFRKPSKPE